MAIEDLDFSKSYAAHYISLGTSYVKNAMLSFKEDSSISLAPFDKEYPRTIFLSGTIVICDEMRRVGKREILISVERMQELLNEKPYSWQVQLPNTVL